MAASIDDRVNAARAQLLDAKVSLTHEIRTYPAPIDDRDCQFNYLLAQRMRITAALKALDSEF